jgi:hypothetical protein
MADCIPEIGDLVELVDKKGVYEVIDVDINSSSFVGRRLGDKEAKEERFSLHKIASIMSADRDI